MVTVLSKRECAVADAEWVMVGLKESKSVEKGWVVVPEKKTVVEHKMPVDKQVPVDKMLASYGFCSKREAKAWVRNGRVTFEGEVLTRIDQKVVVRLYDGVVVDGKPVPVTNVADKENRQANVPLPDGSDVDIDGM